MAAVIQIKKIVRPYRPSNGTEGMWFFETHCDRCIKDAKFSDDTPEDGCQILAATYAFDVTDPRYPKEWIEVDDGPMCTAYVPDVGQDPDQPSPRELEAAGQQRLF